jgi:hypothetical protein
MAGLIAEGGGDRRVVTESEVDLTVLSVFDSVTIDCAFTLAKNAKNTAIKMNFLFICVPFMLTFIIRYDRIL